MVRAASRFAVSTWGSREPGMRSHRLTVGHLLTAFGRGRRQKASIEQQHAVDAAALDEACVVALAFGIVARYRR